jgi:ectoine hydroxylase-related dioxygenase (phytanoyl-CoA dioxygenase family)
MAKSLQTVASDAPAAIVIEHLERDGAVIVEDALSAAQLQGLNTDLDDVIAATAPGLRHPSAERMVEFYGHQTIRLDGLPAKSTTFCELLSASFMSRLADDLLLPNCVDYLLNTAQLIQIGPGETAQALHRDEDAWSYYTGAKPLLQVEAMFALSDFSIDNGCTQVVPGSHRWEATREAQPEEIGRAEMSAGSALVYLGSTMHGGGANVTADEWRRGMFFGYVVGWLRTEENFFLTVPIEQVRDMPTRAQELLGYKAHGGIGVVDVGSPMVMLD